MTGYSSKWLAWLSVFLLLSTVLVASVAAAPENQAEFYATEDIFLDGTAPGTNRDAYPLRVANSLGAGGEAPSQVSLVKFNVGTNPLAGNAIAKARLNLAVIGLPCGAAANAVSVNLYGTTSSGWSETTATWNSVGPGAGGGNIKGALLDTSDTLLPPVGHAYWTDSANGAFAQYVENARLNNGGVVSLWLEIVVPSGTTSGTFENQEQVGAANSCAGANLRPALQVADLGQPLTVNLREAGATAAPIWPFYAGLAALAALVAAGVTLSRRRALR